VQYVQQVPVHNLSRCHETHTSIPQAMAGHPEAATQSCRRCGRSGDIYTIKMANVTAITCINQLYNCPMHPSQRQHGC
jgi:hypothetical protein